MKSLVVCSMFLVLVAGCADEDAGAPGRTVSTGVTLATQPASSGSTTSPEPTTTAPGDSTASSEAPETTVETLDPLNGLAYESVATASFPISLTPDPVGDRDLLMLRVGEVTDLATGEVLLDITDSTRTDGERGLLDALVAPEEFDSALFVHYSDRDGATTVSRFQRDGDRFDREAIIL